MKKILIVDVPDENPIVAIHIVTKSDPVDSPIHGKVQLSNNFYTNVDYTELTPPTDEEISLEADKYYMAIPKSEPKRNCDISFIRGANWMLKQLGL